MYLNTTIPFELPAVMFGTQLSEEGSSILFPPCVFPQYDFTHVYGNWVPPKIQMEAKVNHLTNGTFMELRSRNESNTFKFKCEPTACSWGCQQVEKSFSAFLQLETCNRYTCLFILEYFRRQLSLYHMKSACHWLQKFHTI